MLFRPIRVEKSSDQVIKPVNVEALTKWVGKIPDDVVKDMTKIAPILSTLGYDADANPPNYGDPDPSVADNSLHIKQNPLYWKEKEEEILDREKNKFNHPPMAPGGQPGGPGEPAIGRRKRPPGMGKPPSVPGNDQNQRFADFQEN